MWFEQWETFKGRNCSFLDFANCDNSGNGTCDVHDHTLIPGCVCLSLMCISLFAYTVSEYNDDVYKGTVTHKDSKRLGHLAFDFGQHGQFEVFMIDTDYIDCAIAYVCGVSGGISAFNHVSQY